MDIIIERFEFLFLLYPKFVLFIDNNQSQVSAQLTPNSACVPTTQSISPNERALSVAVFSLALTKRSSLATRNPNAPNLVLKRFKML